MRLKGLALGLAAALAVFLDYSPTVLPAVAPAVAQQCVYPSTWRRDQAHALPELPGAAAWDRLRHRNSPRDRFDRWRCADGTGRWQR